MAAVVRGDRMEFRGGGGFLSLFGLPFLAVGLGVMGGALFAATKGEFLPVLFAIPFGGIFAAVGAGFVFGRSGTFVDRVHGRVGTWWSCLVIGSKTDHDLAEFDAVTVSREVRRSKNSTYTVYPVRITGPGDRSVNTEEPRDTHEARNLAEQVAKFCNFKVVDRTGDTEVVREAGMLDESLKEKAKRTGERVDVPPKPVSMRSTYEARGNLVRFEIPPTGFQPFHGCQMAFGLFFALMAGSFTIPIFATDMPAGVAIIPLLLGGVFMLIPLVVVVGGAVASAKRYWVVEASSAALMVETHGLLSQTTVRIPTDELEDLETEGLDKNADQMPMFLKGFGGGCIVARSDRESVRFGLGLDAEEIRWIRAVIEYAVTAD